MGRYLGILTDEQVAAMVPSGGGQGNGTVTSVGLTAPSQFSVAASPVTGAGNLALSWANQAAKAFLAGPTSGGATAPTFRTLALTDLPTLPVFGASGASHAAGQVPDPGSTSGTARYLREDGTWVVPPVGGAGSAVGIGAQQQYVEQFTAGGTDDTTQLNNAFAWVAGGANRQLMFTPNKTYTANGTLNVTGASKFIINGQNATIQAKAAMDNSTLLLVFTSSTDGEIRDLNIDGNRANRTPLESTNHNVKITDNCQRLSFRRVTSINACCDGFYINNSAPTVLASSPTDIRFYGCSASNCYRNNVSLINTVRFRDYDGVYNSAVGTAPQAGIDVEPNSSSETGNIDARFYNTTCRGNAGYGFSLVLPNSSAKLYDVDLSANTLGAITDNGGILEVYNVAMNDYTSSVTRGIIDINASAISARIHGITAKNNLTGSDSKPLVYVHAAATGPVKIKGLIGDGNNCAFVNANSRTLVEDVESINHAVTTTATILFQNGGGSVLRNFRSKGLPCYLGYISAPNCMVDMVRLDDPSLGDILLEFASGATGAVVNDFEVTQSVNVPASQVAVQFDANPPARVTNMIGISAGTAYTIAQLLKLNGGAVGSIVQSITPGIVVGYTVANLPSSGPLVYDGSQLWCTNARNSGEAASAGTGSMVVYKTGTGWRIPGVATAVAA